MRAQVSTHSWLRRSTMSLTVSTAPHGKGPSCRNPWSRCCNCAKAVRPIACHIVGPLSIEDESVSSIKDQVGLPCPLCMSLSSNLLCPRKCHSALCPFSNSPTKHLRGGGTATKTPRTPAFTTIKLLNCKLHLSYLKLVP